MTMKRISLDVKFWADMPDDPGEGDMLADVISDAVLALLSRPELIALGVAEGSIAIEDWGESDE